MRDRAWRCGRAAIRRALAARLPATPWSAEFLDELDRELVRRAATDGGPRLTLWYLRQVLSPAAVAFVRASRARRRQTDMATARTGFTTGLGQDLRQAVRSMTRERWTTTLVVVTLAVGTGSVAAMVGLGQRLFLAGPPHVEASEELVRVLLVFDDGGGRRTSPWIPFRTAIAIRDTVDAFAAASIYRRAEDLADFGGRARPVVTAEVDTGYFATLGTRLVVGGALGGDDVAATVIAESVAREEFGSAADALGRTVRVGESTATIVGVAPAGFAGPDLDRVDLWLLIDRERARGRNWWLVGRLAPGAGRAAALGQARAVHDAVDPGSSFAWAREGRVALAGVSDDATGDRSAETAIAALLLAVVALLLVIAWVNVLSLLLVRLTRRRGEILVRVALGVGRWRLARLMLVETLLLSSLGALASLPVAHGQGLLVRNLLLPGVAWETATLDLSLMTVTLLVALLTATLLGLVTARRAHRVDLHGGLSETRRGAGAPRAWPQSLLATAQITLSAAMLLCAGLFVKSFWTMRVTDLGVDAAEVHVVSLYALDVASGSGSADEDALYRRALQALRDRDDGSVALAVGLPFSSNFGMSIHVDGLDEIPELPGGGPFISVVSGGYFETIGTRIVRGQPITDREVATGAQVAVVGESTARALWPGGDAVGRCARIGSPSDPCFRVIGVAEDVHRRGYREPPSMQLYLPLGSTTKLRGSTLLLRPARSGRAYESRVAAEISGVVPEVEYVEVRRLDSFLDPEIRPWKLGAAMMSLVAGLAILVSLAGVFGVLSYIVAQRRREIGLRMALGATTGSIRGLVLRGGLVSGIGGVTIGFLAVLVGSRWLAPLLFETPVADPAVMAVTGAGLIGASVLACLLPAVQASRVDPAASLRAEP